MIKAMKDFQVPIRVEAEKDTLSSVYGKFTAEPFERGFGTTIGNSLRRVLLSSLTGAAVTTVRIEGVLHEFSTIPGVTEDVTAIILNVKSLRFKLHTDKPKTVRLRKKGPGEAKGSDIQHDADLTVLNKDFTLRRSTRKRPLTWSWSSVLGVATCRLNGTRKKVCRSE